MFYTLPPSKLFIGKFATLYSYEILKMQLNFEQEKIGESKITDAFSNQKVCNEIYTKNQSEFGISIKE